VLLCQHYHCTISLHSPYSPYWCSSANIGEPRSPLTLLSLPVPHFVFIPHSSNTFCVLHFSTQHSPSGTPLFFVVPPHSHPDISYCLSNHHLDLQLANISLHLCWISQIEPNDIGILFHLLARYEWSTNRRRASSFFVPLMNCVFLLLLALMRWAMYWMTVTPCLIDIIWLLSWVILSSYLSLYLNHLPCSLVL